MNKLRNIIAATVALGLIAGGCGEAQWPEWEAGQL